MVSKLRIIWKQTVCCGMVQQRTLILSDLRLYLFRTKLFDVLKQHLSDGRLSVALCPCQARVLRAGASLEILVQAVRVRVQLIGHARNNM